VAAPEPVSSTYGVEPAEREGASLLSTLRRRAHIIVLTMLLVGGVAAAVALTQGSSYESTAKLLFRQTIGPEINATGLMPSTPDADNLSANNAVVVGSRSVAEMTARRLGGDISPDDVQRDVVVSAEKNEDVVNVVASAESARRAARLANAYADSALAFADTLQRRRARTVADNLELQLSQLSPASRLGREGDRLRTSLEKVRVLAEAGSGTPQVVQRGFLPTTKAGTPVQTIVLGALFGLVLGIGLALLREQADRRLHRADEVSAAFDAPVLTTVPRSRALKRHVPFPDLPPDVAEAYRMLQANLRYGRSEPVRSVLVTSSRSQEGKTTTAWYLAAAAASAGLSVALVEADLRRPSLASRYGLRPDGGLTEVLRGELSVAEALQFVSPYPEFASYNGYRPGVEVLAAGTTPHDPWALMQSQALGELLDLLEGRHDLVVVDTPPLPHVADAISLVSHVDGVILTASVNSTRGPEARRLRDQLQELGARVIGVVANGGSAEGGYGYAPTSTSPLVGRVDEQAPPAAPPVA
jgi:capsular exopolysaccharide synthesis family protein